MGAAAEEEREAGPAGPVGVAVALITPLREINASCAAGGLLPAGAVAAVGKAGKALGPLQRGLAKLRAAHGAAEAAATAAGAAAGGDKATAPGGPMAAGASRVDAALSISPC